MATEDELRKRKAWQAKLGLAILLLAPTILCAAYLALFYTTETPRFPSGGAANLFFTAIGLIGVLVLPIPRLSRAVVAFFYAPATAFWLLLMMVSYVCSRFGDCL